jgi:hypothetical protein
VAGVGGGVWIDGSVGGLRAIGDLL